MEKTWRWFGRKDKITLPMLRQIGVEGIVTALHDVPNGEIWTLEAIKSLKDYIESHQLRWSVVESLPVSEAIKYAGPERGQVKRVSRPYAIISCPSLIGYVPIWNILGRTGPVLCTLTRSGSLILIV